MKDITRWRNFQILMFVAAFLITAASTTFGYWHKAINRMTYSSGRPLYTASLTDALVQRFHQKTGYPVIVYYGPQMSKAELNKRLVYPDQLIARMKERGYSIDPKNNPSPLVKLYSVEPKATVAEFTYFPDQKSLLVVFYTSSRLPSDPIMVLPPVEKPLAVYGQLPLESLSPASYTFIDMRGLPLDRFYWNSTTPVDLSSAEKNLRELDLFMNRKMNYGLNDQDFQDNVRDLASSNVRYRLFILRSFGIPFGLFLMHVSIVGLVYTRLRFLAKKISPLAKIICQESGREVSMPGFFRFVFTPNLAVLETTTVAHLSKQRRDLLGQLTAERTAENLNRDLRLLLARFPAEDKHRRFIKQTIEDTSLDRKERLLRRLQIVLQESIIGPKTGTRVGTSGRAPGRRLAKPHWFRLRRTEGSRKGDIPESKIITLESRFKEALPAAELSSPLPDSSDTDIAQALVYVLMSPGSRESRFDSKYRPSSRVRRMTATKYYSWYGKPINLTRYDHLLSWLCENGIVVTKPKPDEVMLSLTSKIQSGKNETARELIRLIVRAADVMSTTA